MQDDLLESPSTFFYNFLLIILIIAVLIAAYFLLFNPETLTDISQDYEVSVVLPEPTPRAINSNNLILNETFEVDRGFWTLSPPNQARFYGRGLLLDDNEFEGHAWAKAGLTYDNFVLNVNTRWVGGSIGGTYGIRFRSTDDNSFYAIYLHNDGRYTIGRQLRNETNWEVIASNYVNFLETKGGVNNIQIEAHGNQMRFFLNGVYVADVTDSRIPMGDIEFVALKVDGTEQYMAGFDNLLISQSTEPISPYPSAQ